jgi:hypothetical protein
MGSPGPVTGFPLPPFLNNNILSIQRHKTAPALTNFTVEVTEVTEASVLQCGTIGGYIMTAA